MHSLYISRLFFALTISIICLQLTEAKKYNPKRTRVKPSTKQNHKRWSNRLLPKGVEPSANCKACQSSITFSSKEANKYQVGTSIPGVPFQTKNSWAGTIPFPDTGTTKGASLYFWFWAKDAKQSGDDLVIWLNGGPGCSSLQGLLQENGPFLIQDDGTFEPNPYSWTLAANILYINQPVGVSFTIGQHNNQDEFQISDQFSLWLIEFFKIFPELKNKNLWLTGESYSGFYLPFIFQSLEKYSLAGNYKGGMLIDPYVSNQDTQFSVPAYQFVKEHQHHLHFSDQDVAIVKNESDACQLTTFAAKYLKYPPKGRLPTPDSKCDPMSTYLDLAAKRNKNFNVYNIEKPYIQSQDIPTPAEKFLTNPKVQSYINAPKQEYINCQHVFGNQGDQSLPPDQIPDYHDSYLAHIIEKGQRFIILNGVLDGLLISQGNRLALQNLSWNNGQGFSVAASIPLFDMEGKQAAIATKEERSLVFAEVANCGHLVPKDQPSFALAALLHLLNQRDWTKK